MRRFPEPQFNLAAVARPGDPELAGELVHALYAQGFDVAHASELRLDHGTTLPLAQIGIAAHVAVVPVLVNSIFAPLPTLARCRALGAAVAEALRASTLGRRVALLATGGVSHTVGAPGMERNDPAFDAAFLGALARGDLDRACAFTDDELDASGNGTHEVRNWVAVAGAMHPAAAARRHRHRLRARLGHGRAPAAVGSSVTTGRTNAVLTQFLVDVTRGPRRGDFAADRRAVVDASALDAPLRAAVLDDDVAVLWLAGAHPMALLYYARGSGWTNERYYGCIERAERARTGVTPAGPASAAAPPAEPGPSRTHRSSAPHGR